MARSSYLDSLINGRTPGNTNNRYLSELWANNGVNTYSTYRFSELNNFTNEIADLITGSEYLNNLNTNQTVYNMSNPKLANITFDTRYLPVARLAESMQSVVSNASNFRHPPEYLPARITSVKGSSTLSIPILFPAGFSRSISAHFAKENPVGSVTPIVAYSYTDAEEIPFEFDALADYLPSGYSTLSSYIEAILSILKPQRTNNIIYEPTVIVEFADMYFKGICTSVSINYDNVYNYKSFVHARISCQFTRLS